MLRRMRALGWALVVIALALSTLALALPTLATRTIRQRVLPRAEERLGRRIDVGEITFRLGRLELSDLIVRGGDQGPPPLHAPRVVVRFRLGALLTGRLAISSVVLERPRLTIVRDEQGRDNVTPILQRLRGRRGGPAGRTGRHSGPDEVRIDGGSLTVEDDLLGVVEVGGMDVRLVRDGEEHVDLRDVEVRLSAGPTAKAQHLSARFVVHGGHLEGMPSLMVEGGEARIWKGFAVTGVRGGVTPDAEAPGHVQIDLRGGYGGVDKVLWSAKGWAEPRSRKGQLELVAARFDLGQLAPILAGTPIQDPARTQVDARLSLAYRPDDVDPAHLHDALDFDGRVHLEGLNVFHPMLGPVPVRGLGFDASARGRLEPRARALHVDAADVDFRGLHAHLDLDASKLDRLRRHGALPPIAAAVRPPAIPALRAHFTVDPVPCQKALDALPAELIPNLQGFRLAGTFQSEIHLDVDPDKLEAMDLGSKIGIDGCQVQEAPAPVAARKLRDTFDHAVEVEPGRWLAFPVGPENPEWVPFEQISRHLVNSIMTTEDSTFLQHKGFIGREFKSALRTNLERGYFRLGASSITMQLVKNVLLSREKTLSRKLQELFLTWYVEKNLSKSRILEVYFNVIEYGPGIWGIGRAARHYFGKSAKDLTPREAAFFSSILPSPKRRYAHYCKGPELDAKWEQYLNRILRRMHERGRLTDAEYAQALATPLRFDRAEAMPADKCSAMVKRLSVPRQPGTLPQPIGIPIPLARALEAAGAATPLGEPMVPLEEP